MNILNYLPQLGLKPNLVNGMLFSSFASSVPTAPLVYLLRDEFSTDEAAPLASPRTCEPGPGTLTLVQTDGQFSISGGKLVFPAQATPAWGDQALYESTASARTAGRVLLAKLLRNETTHASFLGWVFSASGGVGAVSGTAIYIRSSAQLNGIDDAGASEFQLETYSAGVEYLFALVQRAIGTFMFVKGGVWTNWTLLWVDYGGVAATIRPAFSNLDGTGTLGSFRVLDLPAPWDTDYGIATQRLAGSVSAGTTFTHEANCLIEYTATTVNSGGNIAVVFRQQDANNRWEVWIQAGGSFYLVERVAGVNTTRSSAASVIANGHRVVIIADGTTIRGYSNNVLRWTYASATNFQTATAGELNSLGTGGAVSDLITWPRTVTLPGGL